MKRTVPTRRKVESAFSMRTWVRLGVGERVSPRVSVSVRARVRRGWLTRWKV